MCVKQTNAGNMSRWWSARGPNLDTPEQQSRQAEAVHIKSRFMTWARNQPSARSVSMSPTVLGHSTRCGGCCFSGVTLQTLNTSNRPIRKALTMGICLCSTTGKSMNCTCGSNTVFWTVTKTMAVGHIGRGMRERQQSLVQSAVSEATERIPYNTVVRERGLQPAHRSRGEKDLRNTSRNLCPKCEPQQCAPTPCRCRKFTSIPHCCSEMRACEMSNLQQQENEAPKNHPGHQTKRVLGP